MSRVPFKLGEQAAVSEEHIVLAAEVVNAANDTTCFEPMVMATSQNLADARSDNSQPRSCA